MNVAQSRCRPASRWAAAVLFPGAVVAATLLSVALAANEDDRTARGSGRFQFEPPVEIGQVPDPTRVDTADFDGTQGNDIAIASRADNAGDPGSLFVLLNNGDGLSYRFTEAPVGVDPRDVVIDDFDQRNGPDAVVPNAGDDTIAILLNSGLHPGGGVFEDPVFEPVGDLPVAAASGNVNGDQFPDLAVANQGESTVSILQNDGTGSFVLRQTLNVGGQPTDLAFGEFLLNGLDDLMVTLANGKFGWELYRNDGQGNYLFQDGGNFGGIPLIIEPEDVDGDKDIDNVIMGQVLGDGLPGFITILINQSGDGFLQFDFPGGSAQTSMTLGDFDKDNDQDVLVVGEILGAQGDIRAVLVFRNEFRETGEIVINLDSLVDVDPNQRFVAGELLDEPGGDRDLVTIDVDPTQEPLRGNIAVLLGIPPCNGDIDGNGVVDVEDLNFVLTQWGTCGFPCPPICSADVNGDCAADMADLLVILSSWGPCP